MPLSDATIRVTVTADPAPLAAVDAASGKLTSTLNGTTGAAARMTTEIRSLGSVSSSTASKVAELDRAMASGGVRVAAMEAGMGGMGMALGRVAAASSTLAPILSAAFPVIGALALGQVLEGLVGKAEDWAEESQKIKQQWQDIDNTLAHEGETAEHALGTMEAKTIELTRGPLEALRFQLAGIRDEAGNLDAVTGKIFADLGKVLDEQNLSAFNPARWFGEGTGKLQDQLKGILPDLQKTLNTEGAASGLQKLTDLLNQLYEKRQQLQGDQDALAKRAYPFAVDDSRIVDEIKNYDDLIPRLERLQQIYAEQTNVPVADTAEKRAELAKKMADLAADAARADREEERRDMEAARADYEKSLEALRAFTGAQVEGAHQQAQEADETAAAFRSGSTQRISTFTSEAIALKSEQLALQDGMNAAQSAGNEKAVEIYRHAYDAIGALVSEFNRKAAAESREGAQAAAREYQRIADERLGAALRSDQSQAATATAQVAPVATPGRGGRGGISPEQELQQRKAILDAELEAEQDAILDRIQMLDTSDEQYKQKWQALQDQLATISEQHNVKIAQLNKAMMDQITRDWQKGFQQLNGPLTSALDGMVNGTERPKVAFARMGASMLDSVLNSMLQMTLRTVEQLAVQQIAKETANAIDIGSTAATAATKNAIEGQSSMKSLAHSAVSAAGKAWDALAGIPIIGPILGAAAAAAAFAGVMALGALASAEQGAVLPQDTLLLAHRNEMVLPAHISAGLQDLFGGRGRGGESESGTDKHETHVHINHTLNASAIDSRGMRGLFEEHKSDLARIAHRMIRNGTVRVR